jgi:hypothetical protein
MNTDDVHDYLAVDVWPLLLLLLLSRELVSNVIFVDVADVGDSLLPYVLATSNSRLPNHLFGSSPSASAFLRTRTMRLGPAL